MTTEREKNTKEINIGTEKLATAVQKLGELREYTESSVNAMGSLEAEKAIFANIPDLALIVDGSLKSSRNGSILTGRVASLTPEQINLIQGQIVTLLGTVLAVGSLAAARRLQEYLQSTLPKTQAGFKTLRLIAEQFAKALPLPEQESSEDIPTALKVLVMFDERLKVVGLKDPTITSALDPFARSEAQARLEKSKIDGSEQVNQIRAERAKQRIFDLKREPVAVPGSPGYSRYEILLNQIIERDNLFTQLETAREETRIRQEKERERVLSVITQRRATNAVMAQIDLDPLLCQALANRSRLTPEELLVATPGVKKGVANNALNSNKIILSVEDRRVFNGEAVMAKERARLTQSLLDPLSFVINLTEDEISLIRQSVSKVSDERSIYQLAGNILRKQLGEEVTDEEIVTDLIQIVLDEMLTLKVPKVVDAAIAQIGIQKDKVLKDPNSLDQLGDQIIAKGLELLIAVSLEEEGAERLLSLTDSERRKQREDLQALFRARKSEERTSVVEARRLLDQDIEVPKTASLGTVALRRDIKSSLGPFQIYPEYKTRYPEVVIQALGNLYAEYNQAFGRIVAANKEADTDYQFCMAPNGTPINSFVQIDMVGLPAGFLEQAPSLREEDVREVLRAKIFEIESSIAMYSLLEYLYSDGITDTLFRRQFTAGLDNIRQRYGRPIALLAVTDQKYQAIRETEFGKKDGEPLTDEEVRQFSGFDRLFSPATFKKYLEENGGQTDYLLYVRSSDPVAKMKRPDLVVDEELLADSDLRRIIKANTLTLNIDDPSLAAGDSRRINDTKEYLVAMGMASPVFYLEDLNSAENMVMRAKPMKGTYGGYGHFRGVSIDAKFRRELRDALLKRGSYVVQPELQNPTLINLDDEQSYLYIDRVFFSSDGQNYQYMGGERTLMPVDSGEAQKNTIHGNPSSVYAEII